MNIFSVCNPPMPWDSVWISVFRVMIDWLPVWGPLLVFPVSAVTVWAYFDREFLDWKWRLVLFAVAPLLFLALVAAGAVGRVCLS